MSTEQTESVAQYGDDGHGAGSIAAPAQVAEAGGSQAPANSSSTGGRRRRRRRKGKGPVAAVAQGAGDEDSTASPQPQFQTQPPGGAAPATPAGGAAQPGAGNGFSAAQGQGQAHSQGQNPGQGGGKRKNRKRAHGAGGGAANNGTPGNGGANGFAANNGGAAHTGQNGNGQGRSRQNRPNGGWKARNNEGPDGNREGARGGFGSEAFNDNIGNSNGMRRKGKFGRNGGGPRSFVGPMDHSYRMVNGNIADGPPSTMDYRNANGNTNGNVHGRNDMADYEPVALLREDAPTRIVCFIEDLFVVAKMQETARKLGVKVQFAKAEKEAIAAITDAPEGERPSLIVFDLNNAAAKPLTLIPKLKAKLKRSTSIIGFLQHIQGDLKLKATEAGCDSVMPRSAFSQNLPNLLRRHGFAEEEEMMEV